MPRRYEVDPQGPFYLGDVDFSTVSPYAITAEETAAGVTPTTFSYLPEYIERQGAVADLATDNLAAVNKAISVNHQNIRSFDGDFLVSTDPTNTRGVQFQGTGAILKAVTGGYQQLNSYADLHKYYVGKEYLYRVYARLVANNQAITAFVYGDSTIAGGNGESAPFRVQTLIPALVKYKGLKLPMTVTNRGVAGTKVSDMSALGDLAATTDLFFIKYGINDGLNSLATRLDTFATALRSKLAAIRAAVNGNYNTLAIVLVGPNATADSPNNRDERWYEQLRGVYIQAARDYKCMYFDTYAYLKDARSAAIAGTTFWMDDPFGDGRTIHPLDHMQSWIWGGIVDAMFGQSEAAMWRSNLFTNIGGTYETPTHAAAPSTYDYGITVKRATTGNSWPEDGVVITTRQLDGPALQVLFPFAAGRTIALRRVANTGADAWNLWTGQVNALTLANAWVTFGGGFDTPKAVLGDDGIVTVSMLIKSGTTIAGTTITTLPAGMRPSATAGPFATVNSAGAPAASVRVDTSGNVIVHAALDAVATSIQFSFRAA
jgi:lysophospholipase L1-like esterase